MSDEWASMVCDDTTRKAFAFVPDDWTGPLTCRALFTEDGALKRIVGIFKMPDGRIREADTRYLKRQTKTTWRYPLKSDAAIAKAVQP